MVQITLQDIGGYVTERNILKLILMLSNHSLQGVKFTDISVTDCDFVLNTDCEQVPNIDEKDNVWLLGAIVFYATMGVEVFEGKGQEGQTAETAVPHIPTSHLMSEVALLIHRCLEFDKNKRPTMQEIRATIESIDESKFQPTKRLVTSTGKSYTESLVKFWPEEMLGIIFLIASFLIPHNICAQSEDMALDAEINAILERCRKLRGKVKDITNVTSAFENDTKWTLLDEIAIDRRGECTTKDPVKMFGVNNICVRILKYQGGIQNMGGRFRNGQDPRYKYSFIEITVKQKCTVNYEIKKRKGTQTFAVLPYDESAIFDVKLEQGGTPLGLPEKHDDIYVVTTEKKMKLEDKFTLSITNNSASNMSFVVVNYNSRN